MARQSILDAVDNAVRSSLDATDKLIGKGLDAGGKVFEDSLIKPVGEVIGTMIGDKESAKSLGNRVLGELTGIGNSEDDE